MTDHASTPDNPATTQTHHLPPEAPVLLGLGDAEDASSLLALEWAAQEAVSLGRRLHIVRAYRWPLGTVPWGNVADYVISEDLRDLALATLAKAQAHVTQRWPDLECTGEIIDAFPDQVLLERSAKAEVTVLGSRQPSLVGGAVLGAVSTVVATRAAGRVVVVAGPPADPAGLPHVVVGVDGSDESQDALGFAFDHASRRGLELRAIFCWRPDLIAAMQWRPEQPVPERADRWLAEAVSGWQEKYPDVVVHRAVVRAHPVAGLIAESLAQDLLVVGGRSHHPRLGRVLGSVSQGVLHHAQGPVAVVHHGGPA